MTLREELEELHSAHGGALRGPRVQVGVDTVESGHAPVAQVDRAAVS